MPGTSDDWFGIEEAARRLGLPERAVRRLIFTDVLDAMGPPWRVRRRHLDAFVERSRIRPGTILFLDATKQPRAAAPRVNWDGTADTGLVTGTPRTTRSRCE